MSAAVSAAIGVLACGGAGLLWPRLLPWFAARSEEASEQPGWTTRLTRAPVLTCAGAVIGGIVGWSFGLHWTLLPALALVVLLLGVSAIDLRYRIIPNRLTGPGVLIGLVLGIAVAPDRWLELLIATAVATLLLLVCAFVSPAGMGMGDVKLAGMLGAFLGAAVSVAMMLGLILAALPSLLLLARHGRGARSMTFGLAPFLAAGAILALVWGDGVIDWYMS